jgi:hypothetical protein
LREVLKKHTPAIVVVDLFYLGMETPYGETGFISNCRFVKHIGQYGNVKIQKERIFQPILQRTQSAYYGERLPVLFG